MSDWVRDPHAGELWGRNVANLQSLYASGATTVSDVIAACLQRAADVEVLGAVASINATALAQAAALDASAHRGPLYGVPILVKDNLDVAGETTTAGSAVLAGAPVAARDAPCVARLRAAGAVILGRSTMHEFAWGITSRHPSLRSPINPYDAALIAGGSSGGSAAAVAAGIVPIALGTDTAGSVRIPAAWCGVVGLKGAWEWIPSEGSVALAPSLDSVGAIARTVDDAVLACEVMADVGVGSASSLARIRVGLAQDPAWPELSASHAAAMQWAREALEIQGIRVRGVSLEVEDRTMTPYELFGLLQQPEALAVHRDKLATWPAKRASYGEEVAKRLTMAERVVAHDLSSLQPEVERHRARLAEIVTGYDVVLAPVSAAGPSSVDDPERVELGGNLVALRDTVIAFTAIANLIGVAAISVPSAVIDVHGIPVGIQVIAGAGGLATAVAVARVLERAAT